MERGVDLDITEEEEELIEGSWDGGIFDYFRSGSRYVDIKEARVICVEYILNSFILESIISFFWAAQSSDPGTREHHMILV